MLKPDRSNSDAWLRHLGLVLMSNGLDFLVRDAENVCVGLSSFFSLSSCIINIFKKKEETHET